MIRSAKWVEFSISDPPKPRLIASTPGNEASRSQSLMLELPTNRKLSFGGAPFASAASNAAMSFSQRAFGSTAAFSWAPAGKMARATPILRAEILVS